MTRNFNKVKRIACFLLSVLAAVMLVGCGDRDNEAQSLEDRDKSHRELPSVNEYSSEAQMLRTGDGISDLSASDDAADAANAAAVLTEDTEDPEELEDWAKGLNFPKADTQTVTGGSALAGENGEKEQPVAAAAQPDSDSGNIDDDTSSASIAASETAPTGGVQSVSESSVAVSAVSETSAVTIYAETAYSETAPAVSEASVAAASAGQPSEDYDPDFFSSDLFIGDSISTGYSLYGFMDEKNVFAKIGLNPSSVLTKSVSTVYGSIGVSDMLLYSAPKRVYIMLGSNGIQWLSVGNMLESINKLAAIIGENAPGAEIVMISVPPVTAAYDSTVDDVNVMEKIDDYNKSLESYCDVNGFIYVDAASVLKDSTGYFSGEYAESDGMHFKSKTYKILLSKIQSDVCAAESFRDSSGEENVQTEPADEGSTENVTEPADEDGTESVTEPADEDGTESVTEPADEDGTESVTEPQLSDEDDIYTSVSTFVSQTEPVSETEISYKKKSDVIDK